jgi:hypothetical protein
MNYVIDNAGKYLMYGGQMVINVSTAAVTSYSYTDDFQAYSTGNLDGQGNWITGLNNVSVVDSAGNKLIKGAASNVGVAKYNKTMPNDQYSRVTIVTASNDSYIGVGVRLSGSAATFCGYVFGVADGNQVVYRYDNGSATTIESGSVSILDGDVITLEATGNYVIYSIDSSMGVSSFISGAIDASEYSSGNVGVLGYASATETGDNWSAGEIFNMDKTWSTWNNTVPGENWADQSWTTCITCSRDATDSAWKGLVVDAATGEQEASTVTVANESWENWGIPVGKTICSIQCISYKRNLVANTGLTSLTYDMDLIDSDFASITGSAGGTIPTVSDTTVDGSYVELGSSPMQCIKLRPSNSLIRLYLRLIVTSSGAGGDIRFDDVKHKIYYY